MISYWFEFSQLRGFCFAFQFNRGPVELVKSAIDQHVFSLLLSFTIALLNFPLLTLVDHDIAWAGRLGGAVVIHIVHTGVVFPPDADAEGIGAMRA